MCVYNKEKKMNLRKNGDTWEELEGGKGRINDIYNFKKYFKIYLI